ncbi:MAG: ParA family protein [Anaplasmataceae bacterium]|nr:ParA family protein [Anaplasmataceae bacterium]
MTYKKITIWSTKGGVGKTSICAELHFRLGFPVVTNEEDSMLSTVIDNDCLKILKPKEKIQNYNNNILFDFGGYIDNRIINALEQSNYIIIPTIPSILDIQGCLNTVKIVEKYNSNIVIIINKTDKKDDYNNVIKIFDDLKINKIFEIKKSSAFQNIFIKQKSIKEIIKLNPLFRYSYNKLDKQLQVIVDYFTLK